MNSAGHKPRVAVVSPFLDMGYGTERIVIEWISRLCSDFDFHVYSQDVHHLDLSKITWHRIPKLRGPHLFNYLWWFAANHLCRAWHRRFRKMSCDMLFSPGVNCLDADAISVHIVFAELLRRLGPELKFSRTRVSSWPLLLHRGLYYRLIVALEKHVFTNPRTQLILTSPRTAEELVRFYSRREQFPVVCAGVDHATFNPALRMHLRAHARSALGITSDEFALLLIGNDWRKKGLPVLLDAIARMPDIPIKLLVVTNESPAALQGAFSGQLRDQRVCVLPPRADVETFYAAADVYTGPSLEDTFALPASEAMACGIPVVMSSRAGISSFITDGIDGCVLNDPTDASSLESIIRKLYGDAELRDRIGARASETARQFTWEQNAQDIAGIFRQIIRRKSQPDAQTLAQES